MKYSLEITKEQFNSDQNMKFLFFWGHTPNKNGSIGKSCFSQWWNATFSKGDEIYKTAEHFMMAEKALLFEDLRIRAEILACEHPAEAKKLGREVKNFDASIWDEHKYEIVKEANHLKFSQHVDLKEF